MISLHLSSAGLGGVALAESQHSGVHLHPKWNHGVHSSMDFKVRPIVVQVPPVLLAH